MLINEMGILVEKDFIYSVLFCERIYREICFNYYFWIREFINVL